MVHAALAALCVLTATAPAQTPPPTTGAAPTAPAAQAPASEETSRELDAKLEEAKKELREEIRAQLATQQAAGGFGEEFGAEPRTQQLELLTLDGYLRTRPKLFFNFDLDRTLDSSGFPLFPVAPGRNTQAFADMRLRLEPTLNISEEVAIKLQADVLDNVVFGSTPESGFTASPWFIYDVFNESQVAPRSGINAVMDSIMLKRAYGEVSTPVGVLRFGRMGSHWGMGLLYNDGNCLDCDWGDTVDRIMFVTEIFDGIYVAPMLDFNTEGPVVLRRSALGEPVDVSNLDDSHSLNLAIARRDTDQQRRAKLDDDQTLFNYGLHFSYRTQSQGAEPYYGPSPIPDDASNPDPTTPPEGLLLARRATLYIPDVWLKLERRDWRVELEVAGVVGSIDAARVTLPGGATTPDFAMQVMQFGGALQGEYRLVDGNLKLGMEVGFASGDEAPGLGNRPGRRPRPGTAARSGAGTLRGDIDGPQFNCTATACGDNAIRNFRFDRDYRVDMILWRDLLGAVTDAAYVRPSVSYQLAPGLELFGAAIYSRVLYPESAPAFNPVEGDNANTDPNLGVELNAGASYETEDGFIAGVRYGILFPLGGLRSFGQGPGAEQEAAQAVRGFLGIRF